ncbi:hypothetical protein SBDP1_600006 [Syntrophobacter sp. SbD1]|nr:hypothetical protein SBDP1_600006 [Syntrophobacter sp. SbD1]
MHLQAWRTERQQGSRGASSSARCSWRGQAETRENTVTKATEISERKAVNSKGDLSTEFFILSQCSLGTVAKFFPFREKYIF